MKLRWIDRNKLASLFSHNTSMPLDLVILCGVIGTGGTHFSLHRGSVVAWLWQYTVFLVLLSATLLFLRFWLTFLVIRISLSPRQLRPLWCIRLFACQLAALTTLLDFHTATHCVVCSFRLSALIASATLCLSYTATLCVVCNMILFCSYSVLFAWLESTVYRPHGKISSEKGVARWI